MAGQWSLLAMGYVLFGAVPAFQSPSLRGSGRFRRRNEIVKSIPPVSIPFIAGQWSLRGGGEDRWKKHFNVSIPFIAGQWSLRGNSLKPPHAAACFNPLHCGAVVASRGKCSRHSDFRKLFQSPSLRGSGRFPSPDAGAADAAPEFQSPSLRGSGRFRGGKEKKVKGTGFNPLHCGAVVASSVSSSTRFERPSRLNPLHCRAVVASGPGPQRRAPSARVSIPFIAGQWSLPDSRCAVVRTGALRFNPLHCGAVVASRRPLV